MKLGSYVTETNWLLPLCLFFHFNKSQCLSVSFGNFLYVVVMPLQGANHIALEHFFADKYCFVTFANCH